MKKITTLVILVLTTINIFSQDLQADQSEVLTNESIVSMVKAKMTKKIIVSKITTTRNTYDMSAKAIIELNNQDLGEDLIYEMFNAIEGKREKLEVMTNELVIEMHLAKVSKKLILAKIKESSNVFDLRTDALIKLTENKIPNDVQMAIMEAKKNQEANMGKTVVKNAEKKYNRPTDLSVIKEAGIYYFDGNSNSFTKLDPNIFSQSKVSGGLLSAATYGAFKVKAKASLNGNQANFQFNDTEVNFYFYFNRIENNAAEMDIDLFKIVESPNEFTLAKFKVPLNKNIREIEMGSATADGVSNGVWEGQVVNFKYEKINQNLYRIYFPKPLENGEYCFMPTINSATQGQTSKMYDFGIKVE